MKKWKLKKLNEVSSHCSLGKLKDNSIGMQTQCSILPKVSSFNFFNFP